MNDLELLQEYATGRSAEAFQKIVDRHLGFVYSAALRQVGDPHLAQDVTQVVFILLARKAKTLSKRTILSGWLHRTAHFAALDAVRAETRRRRREQEAIRMETTMQGNHADAQWNQVWPLLDDAMLHLGDNDRDALVLRFFERRSLREVGEILGITEDTAQKRVGRALEKLRVFFAKHGVAVAAPDLGTALSAHAIQAVPNKAVIAIKAAVALHGSTSSSTAALIHGTMKMMALAKLKVMAPLIVASILAAGAAIVVVAEISSHASTTQGLATTQDGSDLSSEAAEFVKTLMEQNQLPGFTKDEHGTARSMEPILSEMRTAVYPVTRTIHVQKDGKPFDYQYTVKKSSNHDKWL